MKEIILGVTGSIDAYKSADIANQLTKGGVLACRAVEYAILDAVKSADSFGCYIAAKNFTDEA